MKIFPPITEMLWPPGYGAGQLLWARRYVLAAFIAIAIAITVQPMLFSMSEPQTAKSGHGAGKQILVNHTNCQDLRLHPATGTVAAQPCNKSFRMKSGIELAAGRQLPRSGLTTSQGTLTTSDLAITAPKALRSAIWKQRPDNTPAKPSLAQSPSR